MIRPAIADDAPGLAAVAFEVWLSTYVRNGVSALFAEYAFQHFTTARFKEVLSEPNCAIWVSQNSAGIDGFVSISKDVTPQLDECSDVEISTLYVQPRHQGHGIGGELLATALQFARSIGRPNVWLHVKSENVHATKFYLRKGFVKIGKLKFEIENETFPIDVLLHNLNQE